ncbi:MAG: trehalose-6-phosphate synthase [Terriglobia bacterium]|jgi:trehalose 6-phosphate synthase
MRMSLRLIFSLIVGVTLLSFLLALFQVRAANRGLRQELENRAGIMGESLEGKVEPLLSSRSPKPLEAVVTQFGNREHLMGIAVFDASADRLAATPGLEDYLRGALPAVTQVISSQAKYAGFITLDGKPTHLDILPLHGADDSEVRGALAIFHDASFIKAQTSRLWWDTFLGVLVQAVFIALVTLLIIRWSIVRPIARTAKWVREIRAGKSTERSGLDDEDLFKPLAQEVTHLAKTLEAARAAAEEEARLRETAEALWTPERLRVHVRSKLGERPFFVVSNREPYTHTYRGKNVEVTVPASGLVTAIEPILRTCQGMWLAHGSGDADRENVDERNCLAVPPDEPQYTLKRVWLTKEEEEGYYFGFSNEGLWPLCHIAHTRPIFRAKDWEQYRAVNRKFAEALLQEMEGMDEPVVLVQDYHFALLPRLIKDKLPGARVAIFWHIPWPNPEAFAICPWQRQLLEGLLGADLVGFHIQSHCNNFLETVDRVIESRVNWERFTAERGGHLTQVQPFPISVAYAEKSAPDRPPHASPYLDRAALLKEHGVEATYMGIGVERVDYTKGILERFQGLERFFERNPTYLGQFTFVQIGAPSRTHIKRYHELLAEVEAEADRINWRFQTNQWKPILYLNRHHSHQEIQRYYKAADLCMVTSLHDGMNLVAKEYVAACEDDQGVLILSRFAGACHELRDALIVNPYDIEQLAEAVHFALRMDPAERSARMHRMRQIVKSFNIYRWAADLVADLCEIRLDAKVEVG